MLHKVDGDDLVDVERWTGRDELGYALEAPAWGCLGSFAGQPQIAGTVVWTAADLPVLTRVDEEMTASKRSYYKG